MTCRRAFAVDLAAFLHDPADPALASFRAHCAECPDCEAEVRAWTELDQALRGAGPAAPAESRARSDVHPAPAELLAFADAPERLATAERQTIGAHVARCRSCTDELAALRAADFGAIAESSRPRIDDDQAAHVGDARALAAAATTSALDHGMRAPSAAHGSPVSRTIAGRPPRAARGGDHADRAGRHPEAPVRRRRVGARIGRVVLHPAFAYALVLALVYPALRGLLPRVGERATLFAPRDLASAPRVPEAALSRLERSAAESEAPTAKSAPAERRAEPGREEQAGGAYDRLAAAPAPPAEGARAAEGKARENLPGLLKGRVESPAAAGGGAAGTSRDVAWTVVDLDPRRTVEVALQDVGGGLVLRMPAAEPRGGGEVRVVSPGGRKELRQRVDDLEGVVRVPAGWLTRGEYRVEVEPRRGAGGTAAYTLLLR